MKTSNVYSRLLSAISTGKYRSLGLQGGTSSSKTYSTMQVLLTIALTFEGLLISVVAESIPHLKRGALRDFFNIMEITKEHRSWNGSDRIYQFSNGSKIEFFSADNPDKLKGGRRDVLFLNECNNILYSSYRQLAKRTKMFTTMDWNPETRFWFHEKLQGRDNTWFDISTHWDNQYLDKSIRDEIEVERDLDPEWYRVYGEGRIGNYKGLVFQNTKIMDLTDVADKFGTYYYGLDFGFFPDPNAFIVAAKRGRTIYVLKEIVVDELENSEIADIIRPYVKKELLYCDAAEPKSIKELKGARIVAKGGTKHRKYGISWLRRHKIVIDKKCKNLIDEISKFSRLKDKSGNILPVYQDGHDHTLDALRYAFTALIEQKSGIMGTNISGV